MQHQRKCVARHANEPVWVEILTYMVWNFVVLLFFLLVSRQCYILVAKEFWDWWEFSTCRREFSESIAVRELPACSTRILLVAIPYFPLSMQMHPLHFCCLLALFKQVHFDAFRAELEKPRNRKPRYNAIVVFVTLQVFCCEHGYQDNFVSVIAFWKKWTTLELCVLFRFQPDFALFLFFQTRKHLHLGMYAKRSVTGGMQLAHVTYWLQTQPPAYFLEERLPSPEKKKTPYRPVFDVSRVCKSFSQAQFNTKLLFARQGPELWTQHHVFVQRCL